MFIYKKRERRRKRDSYIYIERERQREIEREREKEREKEIKFLIAHFYIPFPLNTIDEYKARDIDKHGI